MIAVVVIVFLVLLILGTPIAFGIGFSSLLPSLMEPTFAGSAVFVLRGIISGANSTPLLALPLFIFSGAIMSIGGISDRLFRVFAYFMGKRTGGMPCAVVITCLFYGAISGSGPATAAAVGGMSIPLLISLGYEPAFAAALVAVAGGLGTIIPPSIPFINYGVVTGTSVGDLFIAGIFPGILAAFCLCAYAVFYCIRHGEDKEKIAANCDRLRRKGLLNVLKESFWALLTPVIILGSIYGGICTPTEAAALSVIYAIIVSLLIYKEVTPKDLIRMLLSSVRSYGPLCLLLAVCCSFSRVLMLLGVPTMLSDYIVANFGNKYAFLLACNILFLILGMFIDAGPALLILAPIVLPTAEVMGINPVHFGVVMVVNLCIGFCSPPFGLNLYVAAPLAGKPVMEVGRKVWLAIGFFMAALALITYIPAISLFLVGL